MGKVKGCTVVVGIPSFGMVSTYFLQSRISQQFPLVSSAMDKIVLNKPIADARNEIVEFALQQGADYIYWLDDDVVAPPDAFLKMYYQNKDIINGVYWSKSLPPMPLLFRGHLEGPYWNWKVGDLLEVDAAGNGLTLVKTDVYRKIDKEIGGPWYSVEYASFPNATKGGSTNTEDLYFYWKAKKAGYKIWVDTSIQALHYEKNSGVLFGMPHNAPQAHPDWTVLPEGGKLIADLGSGESTGYYHDEGKVVTFDIREDVKPHVVCDIRHLPVPDQIFDVVHSSHTLEHFSFRDVGKVLKEWTRVLKVGGELRLVVPNIKHIAERLVKDQLLMSDMFVLYGEQDYSKNFHAAGFTPGLLRTLVENTGCYENIEIKEGQVFAESNPYNWSLQLKATKVKHAVQDNITPEDIEAPKVDWNVNWPIVMSPEYHERPINEEEILKDIELARLNAKPSAEWDLFGPPELRMAPPKQVEVKDGLDSGNERPRSNKRRRTSKASTTG